VDLFETQNCTYFLEESRVVLWSLERGLGGSFSDLLNWNELEIITPDPDKQNTTIIKEANDGKLMFSYECA
jgi:hypothetical protein